MNEMNALEKVDAAVKLLIFLLCIDTNANTATYTVEGFKNYKTGQKYGDYVLTIKRVSK